MFENFTYLFRMWNLIGSLVLAPAFFACTRSANEGNQMRYNSGVLEIKELSQDVYQHISFLETQSFGRVPCNGMVVVHGGEAIVFDTPADNQASAELISWVQDTLQAKIRAIIPTHFHADCLAGLDVFHEEQIPSYGSHRTIALAQAHHAPVPRQGFDTLLELAVGGRPVIARFVGEGHTPDNVVGYFPHRRVIFGGCLVKEMGAGKGNLADANPAAWPLTIRKLKEVFPDAELVIPGHGTAGGTELLDYTFTLFDQE